MPSKVFILQSGMPVKIVKRRGAKYIRLRIDSSGTPSVTVPSWTPYAVGLHYANSKQQWISANHRPNVRFFNNQLIGKKHTIQIIENSSRQQCVIKNEKIIVKIPNNKSVEDQEIQNLIFRKSITALKIEAEDFLFTRIKELAALHNFSFATLKFKNLKSRWGSCDQYQNIVLNIHLMHLPLELIDYVILHELTHTRVMRHGPVFWAEMTKIMPDVKEHKKNIKQFQPSFNN